MASVRSVSTVILMMMGWRNQCFAPFFLFYFFLLIGIFGPVFASTLSSVVLVSESHASTSRNLLQTETACPVEFEFLNYTSITSQCKGPKYPADRCCEAFKEFACPYADLLNDLTNDCALIMFSYINLYGNYPLGLFANKCKESKRGLECPAKPQSEMADDPNGSQSTRAPSEV